MTALVVALFLTQSVAMGVAPRIAREVRAELSRLEGHKVTVAPNGASYSIDRVAGEGRPLVGTIERRGVSLYLISGGRAMQLTGPLARPRIAGPGYKVWVLGDVRGGMLRARRLGVLARPARASSPRPSSARYGTNASTTFVAAKK